MSSLQLALKEAMRLWKARIYNELPKRGFPTYDHFKKLEGIVRTAVIRQGGGGLYVKASAGQGGWAEIPWIGIRHTDLTTNFEEGVYLVYLFSPDCDKIYLAVIQGITKLSNYELAESTPRLRSEFELPNSFSVGIQGKLAKNAPLESKPDKYERGILYSKVYDIQRLPIDSILEEDLKSIVTAYRAYANKYS
jgi:hypothetical protein